MKVDNGFLYPVNSQVAEKVIVHMLLKDARVQGARNLVE